MHPKTGPHSGSQKVRFCNYLLHLSKVRRLRNGPHFGSCLKTRFTKNTKKNWETKDAQKQVQKKVTLRNNEELSPDPEAP